MTEMLNKEFSRKSFVKGGGAMIVGFSRRRRRRRAARRRRPTARSPRTARRTRRPGRRVHRDPRRQHGDGQDRPRRARPGLDHGPADDRGRGARHGRRPDEVRHARHERHAEHRRHGRQQLDRERAARACAARRRPPSRRCSAWRRRSSASPSASLTVEQGRRLGRRQVRHLRRADRRQALQRPHGRGEHQPRPGARRRPVSAYKLVGDAARAAGRHPGQGDGQARLRRRTSASRGCCTAGSSGRAARAPTATARAEDRLGRRELDQAHPRRAGRAARQLPRRRRAEGVRGVQAAAQLKVKWADPPKIASSGNLWKQMRDFDTAGQAPARIAAQRGQLRRRLRVGGEEGLGRRYKHQYNGHMPIGPACAVADVTKDGALVMANTQDAYAVRTKLAGAAQPAAEQDPRPVLGGRELVRQRAGTVRRRARRPR